MRSGGYILASFGIALAWTLCFYVTLTQLFEVKIQVKRKILYFIGMFSLVTALMLICFNKWVVFRTVVISAVMFVLIYYEAKDIIRALLIFTSVIVEMGTAETVNIVLLKTVFEYSVIKCFVINALAVPPILLAAFVVKKIIRQSFMKEHPRVESLIGIVITLAALLIAESLQINFEDGIVGKLDLNENSMQMFVLVMIVTYIAAIISAMSLIKGIREEEKGNIIWEQNKILEEMYDNTRIFRHNYKNMVLTLNAYCDTNDYKKLKEYIKEIKEEIDDGYKNKYIREVLAIKDAGLRNLIIVKISEAKKRGINTEIDITGRNYTEFINMSMINVIGILLDNAIEAAEKSIEKYIKLTLVDVGKWGGGKWKLRTAHLLSQI